MNKISVTRLQRAMRCLSWHREEQQTRWTRQQNEFEVRGQVAHDLAAGGEVSAAKEVVDAALAEQPQEQRDEVITQAVAMAQVAQSDDDLGILKRHPLPKDLRVAMYGWTVFGTPDEIALVDVLDENGQRITVLQITEHKTAFQSRSWHWDQLRLYALLVSIMYRAAGSIRLVVKPMQQGSKPEVQMYSPTGRLRGWVRETLERLAQANESGEFPKTTGFHCNGCRLLAECAEGEQFLSKEQAARRGGKTVEVPAEELAAA